ncbi:Abi family protein [Acinetobacter lwoffii]|uniref:Abi family protein n=1 Tax=Acinetobacter lwoffii TaxID=28090 RepID=UPI003F8D1378
MTQFISSARLDSYRTVLKLHSDEEVIGAYYWNIAVSSAIYPIIHTLEITLRNALDCAVQNYHQPVPTSGKPSYRSNPYWFKLIVTDLQNSKIAKMRPTKQAEWVNSSTGKRRKFSSSENHITTAIREVTKGKPVYQAQDILSKVPFGFWTTFLSKDYEDITNKHLIWPNLFRYVFPNAPYGYKRNDIDEHFNLIREFRNRFAHHEPIWKFFNRNPSDNTIDYTSPVFGLNASLSLLNKQYDDMLEVIRWMSLDTYDSFLLSKMHVDFKKLCSLDGFYAFVNKDKISNRRTKSRVKRELFQMIDNFQNDNVIYIKNKNKKGIVLGVNAPELF